MVPYPYAFTAGSLNCVEAVLEPCRKLQIDNAVLADRKLLELPVIVVAGASMSLLEMRSKSLHFLVASYSVTIEESPVAGTEGVETINVLIGDLEAEADR